MGDPEHRDLIHARQRPEQPLDLFNDNGVTARGDGAVAPPQNLQSAGNCHGQIPDRGPTVRVVAEGAAGRGLRVTCQIAAGQVWRAHPQLPLPQLGLDTGKGQERSIAVAPCHERELSGAVVLHYAPASHLTLLPQRRSKVVTRDHGSSNQRKPASLRPLQQARKLGWDAVQDRGAGRLITLGVTEDHLRTDSAGVKRAIQKQRGPQRSGQPHPVLLGNSGDLAQRGNAGLPGLEGSDDPARPAGRPGAEHHQISATNSAFGDGGLDLVVRHPQERLRPGWI